MTMHAICLHGGAGAITREIIDEALEAKFRASLGRILQAGHELLAGGGSALDAVALVVGLLEEDPLYNAGVGANVSAAGECELDASIMDGRTLAAGAVAGVRTVRSPIRLARAVMERSSHVLLTGAGAEEFAAAIGEERVENAHFQTPFRRAQWARVQELEQAAAPAVDAAGRPRVTSYTADDNVFFRELSFGTVGCVALDARGNLAAATSTGGMMNKRFGRVGDSPLIGAGTYASNASCAVSCTGWGEYFVRAAAAHDVAARMEYSGAHLGSAAAGAIARVGELGGEGGLIAVDRTGRVALPFNSAGMYRAWQTPTDGPHVALFGDE
ncbi:MAG: isoaspartyl peptidase/L-asparaginase [Verrucomicrobia bacterium]|nr:isoaspartyl peptidase/L-asparaginase [Verrucomicrobiota bacterium]